MNPIIKINYKDRDLFPNSVLNDIILRLFRRVVNYNVQYINRNSGKYITIETSDSIKYVVFSASNSKTAHGNTFIVQPLKHSLKDYFSDVHINKSLSVYLMSVEDGAKTKYNLNAYRLLKSCSIDILNEDKLGETIVPFSSHLEWSLERASLNRKQNNSSKLIQNGENNYEFYGKMYGANQCDTFINLLYLSRTIINQGKHISLIPISENKEEKTEFALSSNDLFILRNMGITYENIRETGAKNTEDKKESIRNQTEFKSNLFTKVNGVTTCAFCGCPIYVTQAAHILPVHVIEKDETLSYEEKYEMANDQENGLYLCPTCHRLFDDGNVTYFPENETFFVKDDFFGHEYYRELCEKSYKENLKPYITRKFKKYMRLHNQVYNLHEPKQ